jgi:hypothetical protein
MIKKPKQQEFVEHGDQVFNYPLIFIEGIIVGVLTGLVGAGGGFLIIPALVVLSKLSMKEAVGTSLLIIAAKSLFGFTGEIGTSVIDWKFLISISIIAILGMMIGIRFSNKIDEKKLKPIFGWFILVMGSWIIFKEMF